MGLSKEVFEETGGYGKIHPGEDPDLTFRIWKQGYKTRLFKNAYVYHKRRIDIKKFYNQVNKFGLVRPILNRWHPKTSKLTYWFPTVFMFLFIISIILIFFKLYIPILLFGCYFLMLFISSLLKTKSLKVSCLSFLVVLVQFFGYGYGFLTSTLKLKLSNATADKIFPKLFFK